MRSSEHLIKRFKIVKFRNAIAAMVKILLSSGAALRGSLALDRTDRVRARRKDRRLRALCTGCEQRSFLLNVHFCDSRFAIFKPHGRPRRPSFRLFRCRGTDMTMLQHHAQELVARREHNADAPLLLLAPR